MVDNRSKAAIYNTIHESKNKRFSNFPTTFEKAMVAKRPAAKAEKANKKTKEDKTPEQQPESNEHPSGETLALEDANPWQEEEMLEEKTLEVKVQTETKAVAKPKAKAKTTKSKAKAAPKKNMAKAKPKASCKKITPAVKKKLKKKGGKDKQKEPVEENKGGKTKTKKETMKEKTAAWRKPLTVQEREAQGEEGEEEEQKEADPLVHPEEKRHYAKARKFAKMLKKGQLPEEIKLMYTEAAQKSESPRLFQTQLINKLFQKNKKNEWVMSTDNTEFASWKQSYDKKFLTAKSVGLPPMVMLWQTFHGSKEGMKEAASVGDIFEENGLWYFKQVETGRTKELQDKMEISGGSAQLSVDEFSDMSKWLTSRPWSKYGENLPELGSSAASLCTCSHAVKHFVRIGVS